jgi:FtsP/CotA-like multicopper oxidase with cupredoxin domain
MTRQEFFRMSRRDLFRLGGTVLAGSALALRPGTAAAQQGTINTTWDWGCGVGGEPIPLSPLILNAFQEPLPVPQALAPVKDCTGWSVVPNKYQQNSEGAGYYHQTWTSDARLRDPEIFRIALQIGRHRVTEGPVQYLRFEDDLSGTIDEIIDVDNKGVGRKVKTVGAPENLPYTAITGFSGTPDTPNSATFPGPMINAEYGQPTLIRFVNQLDRDIAGPEGDLMDYGDPERGFLTHLHNNHSACESDGNPNDSHHQYTPGTWCDNLYLNHPAGGDHAEMQSFMWFHDHTHNHTGANVYKGMVGLFPIYDRRRDPGHERQDPALNPYNLRLPGVRVNRPATEYSGATFDVKFDIPLALYDCLIDDGITPHQDWHNGCGETHPEWRGKQFFRHYPNHGFVGDVFTVNGKAYPVLYVKRRKYRLRFLGASLARIYELMFMRGRVAAFPGLQGQYNFVDATGKRTLGQQCFRPLQIASEGGLLPFAVQRDMFEIWPANRKEFILDFTKYMDGSPTRAGDEFYIANLAKMKNGRKPNKEQTKQVFDVNDNLIGEIPDPEYDPNYCVPLMKIVIESNKLERDDSVIPTGMLRPLPIIPTDFRNTNMRHFALARQGGALGEAEWIINGMPFDPTIQMASVRKGTGELWVLRNGSGGWIHPMHLHEEEHQVIARFPAGTVNEDCSNLRQALASAPRFPLMPDQPSKEDVADLRPNEELVVYRRFRSFVGKYVAHCHNLAHEDHAMMFGWEITEDGLPSQPE